MQVVQKRDNFRRRKIWNKIEEYWEGEGLKISNHTRVQLLKQHFVVLPFFYLYWKEACPGFFSLGVDYIFWRGGLTEN